MGMTKILMLIVLVSLMNCSVGLRENKVKNLNTEFDKLWNYSDPVATRGKFEEHLNNLENVDSDYILQLKTQIARTYSLKGEFTEAHTLLDSVEEELSSETKLAEVRYLLERGRAFNSAGEKSKAEELFKKAFKISKVLGTDHYTVDAAHMVAIAVESLDEKINWTEMGVGVARDSTNENVKKWVGVFLNNLGWDLFDAKRYLEALEKFQKCEEFHKESGNKQNQNIALWSIAKTYRYLGKIEESLKIQESLLSEAGGIDSSGYTYEELGELFYLKGDKQKAKNFFRKAYQKLSVDTWLQQNEADRLSRLEELSK
jgi:tetratricopeptide (TPR) repeat protein